MRNPIPFDTHAYVKRLIAAGMPEAQAEVQAEALSEVVLAQIATKDDVRQSAEGLHGELRQTTDALRGEMREMELRLNARIESVELRLRAHFESELRKQMLWYFATQVALFGALFALVKLL